MYMTTRPILGAHGATRGHILSLYLEGETKGFGKPSVKPKFSICLPDYTTLLLVSSRSLPLKWFPHRRLVYLLNYTEF